MNEIDFVGQLHRSTPRDYRERVLRGDRPHCAAVAKRFERDYWDGDRKYGYGGYRYDGRWAPVAQAIAAHYGLTPSSRVLDVGCGKAFLLYELTRLLPGLTVAGIDPSAHALAHAREETKPFLQLGKAQSLPYPDRSFDLVLSINALHNLYVFDLEPAIREIERVKRAHSYIVAESYRNEVEKDNLFNWQLTCECFFTPDEWVWLFRRFGYTGDYSFIFFE